MPICISCAQGQIEASLLGCVHVCFSWERGCGSGSVMQYSTCFSLCVKIKKNISIFFSVPCRGKGNVNLCLIWNLLLSKQYTKIV